jgi:hypothetical protein
MSSVSFEAAVEKLGNSTFCAVDNKSHCWNCTAKFVALSLKKSPDVPTSFPSLSVARKFFYCDQCIVNRTMYEKQYKRKNKQQRKALLLAPVDQNYCYSMPKVKTVETIDECKFGINCRKKKCWFKHTNEKKPAKHVASKIQNLT